MAITEYSSNNSGGDWWLTDQNWRDLEAAGWTVNWFANDPHYNGEGTGPYDFGKMTDKDGRWLRALASHATREGLSMRDAIAEWERVTGESSNALGCSCCGTPHSFSDDEGNYYSPSYPSYGDRY